MTPCKISSWQKQASRVEFRSISSACSTSRQLALCLLLLAIATAAAVLPVGYMEGSKLSTLLTSPLALPVIGVLLRYGR